MRSFPSPPVRELDCRDVIVEKPSILGAKNTGKCSKYSLTMAKGISPIQLFIWKFLFTYVFEVGVPCLHLSAIMTSSWRMHGNVLTEYDRVDLKLVT